MPLTFALCPFGSGEAVAAFDTVYLHLSWGHAPEAVCSGRVTGQRRAVPAGDGDGGDAGRPCAVVVTGQQRAVPGRDGDGGAPGGRMQWW